ncbi:MAG: acyl-CoA thioesterase [Rhodospirillales bacterium]|nr:acyl-CoA thioesterase [Rhodospirillales bacterium]
MDDHQLIVSDMKPLSRRHRVPWGDCDPAGIIYTPRVLDYAIETFEIWNRDILGVSWTRLHREMSMGFPTVRTEIDFLNAPVTDDEIVLEMTVENLGRTSLTSIVTGHDGGGTVYFQVKIISCLTFTPDMEAKPIPDEFRQRILAYQTACQDNSLHIIKN